MGNKHKRGRRKGPAKPKNRQEGSLDRHTHSILKSVEQHLALVGEFPDETSLVDLDARIDEEITALCEKLAAHRPERVVELARIVCLPWNFHGLVKPDTEAGPTKAEALALLGLIAGTGTDDGSALDETPNSLYREAHDWAAAIESVIELFQARELIVARQEQMSPLDFLAFTMRSKEVWMRNTSYPDMVAATVRRLFGHDATRDALRSNLGFDASDALSVLGSLHQLQVDRMNQRLVSSFDGLREAYEAGDSSAESAYAAKARVEFNNGWQPTADLVTVSADDVASAASVSNDVARAVLDWFAVDLAESTPLGALERFVTGDNPLRTNPVIRSARGTYMLVHDALTGPAIRENFEQLLRSLPVWEQFQKWRGDLLEELGTEAFASLIPGAKVLSSFEYFIPDGAHEEGLGADTCTKRVEGDLLVVLDDVAIIVEAKAVAITPESRAGETRRLRRNLVDIITKASGQAARLQDRVEEDGGIRLNKSGWLDLSDVREIHTVALSLEDLSGVSTATSELVAAGLLDGDHIPWVVSVHDLQLITQLVDRPAEFLLYLRRRRDPQVSRVYMAPDEMDLFLYFYEAGLYVQPDPYVMAEELPHIAAPRPGDVRRFRKQTRSVISSRTDPLDAWHLSQTDGSAPRVEKPRIQNSPMIGMVDELRARRSYGWLSIGATLLSGSTKAQAGFDRVPRDLLAKPYADGRERSYAIPFASRMSDAWLLVWMTRPETRDRGEILQLAKDYLHAKKYQLGFNRGAAFLYDEVDGGLIEVVYDGAVPAPDPEMDLRAASLLPVDRVSSPPPPRAKALPARKPAKRKRGKNHRGK